MSVNHTLSTPRIRLTVEIKRLQLED